MVDVFGVPVFHHGGNFSRRASGELVYLNGQVEKFLPMDLDFVNFGDLVTMFKGLGYQSYKEAYWYDPKSKDMESGLHVLRGNAWINQMRQAKLRNKDTEEFYIFFYHSIDEPEIADDDFKKNAEAEEEVDPNELEKSDDKSSPIFNPLASINIRNLDTPADTSIHKTHRMNPDQITLSAIDLYL